MDGDPITIRVLFEEADDEAPVETCPRCGQSLDLSHLAAVLHHRQPIHEPMRAS